MLILFPFVLACAVSDLRTRRIPNVLILCGLIGSALIRVSLIFHSGFPVMETLADGCAGFLLPWLLIGPLAALKMFGGGDVKLLSVIGLWLGIRSCLLVMWYSLLIAAVWSAILVIRRRNLLQRLTCLQQYVGRTLRLGKLTAYRSGTGYTAGVKNYSAFGSITDPESGSGNIPCAADSSGEFCFAVPVLLSLVIVLTL